MARNLLVAHGGGPTAVINCSLYGVIVEARASGDVDRILAARHGIAGVLKGDVMDLTDEPQQIVDGLRTTPASAVGSCRHKVTDEDYDRIFDAFERFDIKYFLYNGGNDSMDTANKVHQRACDSSADVRVAGIPKTIDNDLAYTDHCPGFGSAARYFAGTVRDLGRDIESLPTPVSICEVMGRNAGWLAAATVAAREDDGDAPHLIYLPETPVVKSDFLSAVDNTLKQWGRCVVAASEGARDETGNSLSTAEGGANVDGFGHPLPGGVASVMADWVAQELGVRARYEKPGIPGRASILCRSETDVHDAIEVGRAAVRHVTAGESGHMMGIERVGENPYAMNVVPAPLSKVANVERRVPAEFMAGASGMAPAFMDYLRLLLGGPFPQYIRLTGSPA